MTFDLFGYNGAIELDQAVVNKLLASFVYDRHLVEQDGHISNGDFFTVAAPIDGGELRVYLELARPFLHVSSADGSNLVTLHLPFSNIGVFVTIAGVPQRMNALTTLLALVLFGVAIQKTDQGLTLDFATLTGNSVGLMPIGVTPGPTDVGGSQVNPDLTVLIDDHTLENPLKPDAMSPPVITAKDLRAKLADFLKGGALGTTAVPIGAGGTSSALERWDLMLFGNANDRDVSDQPDPAGADLLLFQDQQHGVGERTQAGFILPAAPEAPGYGWTANLAASVLLDNIRAAMDSAPYWVQRGTVNTAANPLGYMVVPGMEKTKYALPSGTGKVTVHAAQNGDVTVDLAPGALAPHSRAHISNLSREARSDLSADVNGAASVSIRAEAGERLAITVDAVSLPNDTATVMWRPQISFHEGEIDASFHYYHYIDHWCDLEGDASVRLALVADRNQPFAVSVKVIDANASVPWWVYAVTWLGAGLIGQSVFAPILLALIPTIVHSLAKSLIGNYLASAAGALTDQVSAPSIANLAMVLDQIDLHQGGVQLAGRADSGNLLAWGRQPALAGQGFTVIQTWEPNPVYMRFEWKPGLTAIEVNSPVRWVVITDGSPEIFWAATYDDLDVGKLGRGMFTLNAGQSVMAWVELDDGHAKVLFERALNSNDVLNPGIRITWIAYRERVHRAVTPVNHIKAKVVGGREGLLLKITLYAYDGTIDLATTKAFFSDETRALGDEHWFWDGVEITEQGLTLPGGSVVLDTGNRRLLVHLEQAGLTGPDEVAWFHSVEFRGVDVFGHAVANKISVQTPPWAMSYKGYQVAPPLWTPLGDPGPDLRLFDNPVFAGVFGDLATRLGEPQALEIVRALAGALTRGSAVLDGSSAVGILSVLGQR
jgi:hypothetical protein